MSKWSASIEISGHSGAFRFRIGGSHQGADSGSERGAFESS